jgi:two-component system response regulator EvgA
MRVVVADDSIPYRAALCKLLKTIPGISVIAETDNGVDTLRVVRETSPDLLILDLHMPQLSGWGVMRELQVNGDGVRILVHTGYADEHFRAQAFEHGAVAFVAKGNVRLLIDTLTQLMQE